MKSFFRFIENTLQYLFTYGLNKFSPHIMNLLKMRILINLNCFKYV